MAKCRKGRLDYSSLGTLLIILPLSIILLDEFIGDLIVDVLIPSVFSGVMIAGDAMVSVSAALLVVPLFFLFVAFLYIVLIYRPAKIAVKKRLEIKKIYWGDKTVLTTPAHNSRRAFATHGQSSFKIVFKELLADSFRVLRVSYVCLQAMVVQYSINGYEERLKLKKSKLDTWQTMNIPPYVQGYHNHRNSKESLQIETKSHSKRFKPPVEIANMIISTKLKEFYLDENKMKMKKLLEMMKSKQEMVISKSMHHIEIDDRSKLNARIIFEFLEASNLICGHLWPSFDSTFAFVSVSDLSKEFENIWDVFYPDGIMLTEIERKESVELHDIWQSEQTLLYEDIFIDGILTVVEKISFELFEDWFLNHFSQKILRKKSDRLMDYILLCKARCQKSRADGSKIDIKEYDDVLVDDLKHVGHKPS